MTKWRTVARERHFFEWMASAIVMFEAIDIGHAVVGSCGDPRVIAEKTQYFVPSGENLANISEETGRFAPSCTRVFLSKSSTQ